MTQSTNLKLDLLSATDLFDTDKIKSNFEKIDNTVLIPTKIIDNCVTDNSLLPLSAKQGKLLQDQITKLNGDIDILENRINNTKRADDIEVFADGCEVGLTSFICHAETTGLPSSSYTSGTGLVLKRKQENVMVFLISTNTTTALKCKNEGGWRDWREI